MVSRLPALGLAFPSRTTSRHHAIELPLQAGLPPAIPLRADLHQPSAARLRQILCAPPAVTELRWPPASTEACPDVEAETPISILDSDPVTALVKYMIPQKTMKPVPHGLPRSIDSSQGEVHISSGSRRWDDKGVKEGEIRDRRVYCISVKE
ncbi:hypothetical protein Taro_053449 [Colocasia esculenta]|uniref:Uncharacterized protein n=1 Tax=Colocasia esculenta TaxID=4460 RepID=A0A843XMU7_COLES|nr:hypothetical protein [Colocasia esculenta]